MRVELTEGWFLGLAQEVLNSQLADARLVRVLVTDVGEKRAVRAQVGKAAAESLKAGEFLILFRPRGATTARLKQVPDLAPLEEGPAPGKKNDEVDALQLARSFNNLKQIGLALHNFHDVYRHLPPAGINGPDNKSHSWRVLILPFIDHPHDNQYKFDELWMGLTTRNSSQDASCTPIRSTATTRTFTHYAVTGDDMAFTAEGANFDGINAGPAIKGRGMAQFTDLRIRCSSVPWGLTARSRMKPKTFTSMTSSRPRQEGGFAVPYKTEKETPPFVRCDGSAVAARQHRSQYCRALTLDGGEPIGAYPSPIPPQAGQMLPGFTSMRGQDDGVCA
jgi:hypothetical protein